MKKVLALVCLRYIDLVVQRHPVYTKQTREPVETAAGNIRDAAGSGITGLNTRQRVSPVRTCVHAERASLIFPHLPGLAAPPLHLPLLVKQKKEFPGKFFFLFDEQWQMEGRSGQAG